LVYQWAQSVADREIGQPPYPTPAERSPLLPFPPPPISREMKNSPSHESPYHSPIGMKAQGSTTSPLLRCQRLEKRKKEEDETEPLLLGFCRGICRNSSSTLGFGNTAIRLPLLEKGGKEIWKKTRGCLLHPVVVGILAASIICERKGTLAKKTLGELQIIDSPLSPTNKKVHT
jgi:hypothetical protein